MELDNEFLEMVGKIAKLSLEKSHNKKADIFFIIIRTLVKLP